MYVYVDPYVRAWEPRELIKPCSLHNVGGCQLSLPRAGQSTCQSSDQLVNVFSSQTVQCLLTWTQRGTRTRTRPNFMHHLRRLNLCLIVWIFLSSICSHASMTLHLLSGATSTQSSSSPSCFRYCNSFSQQLTMQYADLTRSWCCFWYCLCHIMLRPLICCHIRCKGKEFAYQMNHCKNEQSTKKNNTKDKYK